MNISEALPSKIASNQKLCLGIAVVGALACVGGAVTNPAIFYRGYLLGFMFWMNLTLGCLGLVMMHNLVGGDWGHASRRFLEAGMRTLPLMALLFLLLIPGIPYLYEWANAEHVAHDQILPAKSLLSESAGVSSSCGTLLCVLVCVDVDAPQAITGFRENA